MRYSYFFSLDVPFLELLPSKLDCEISKGVLIFEFLFLFFVFGSHGVLGWFGKRHVYYRVYGFI